MRNAVSRLAVWARRFGLPDVIRNSYALLVSFRGFFRFQFLEAASGYIRYFREMVEYRRLEGQSGASTFRLFPCVTDKTETTPLDPVYFFQDTWAAKKIFEERPRKHVDVGSSAKTIGIISQFVPVTMIDIRPLPVTLPGLQFRKGSILALPFANGSVESISSLCVIEHIGLGRYGDELDAGGSENAIKEIQRVVRKGGTILCSLPVDSKNTVYFNAHRAFTRDYILSLFSDCELIEEKYQYGYELRDRYDATRGFGTGLYMFKKKPESRAATI